jgi:hypothetical protein
VLDLQVAELLGRVRASEALLLKGSQSAEHLPGWVWSLSGMKRAVDEFEAFAVDERNDAEKRAAQSFPLAALLSHARDC